jgi:hypothetical protein
MKPQGAGSGKGWPVSGQLRYPENLQVNEDTDYVSITFYKYVPPFSKQGFPDASSPQANNLQGYNQSANSALKQEGPSIILYMPEDVGVKYGANWGDKNISNAGRSMLGAAGDIFAFDVGGFTQNATKMLTEPIGNALTKGTATVTAIQDMLKKTNVDPSLSFDDLLGGITGQILNPNTEVLYSGPTMRGFDLSFKMAPRNDSEAKIIKNIITAFKYAILPKFNEDASKVRSFVGVPSIADVTFKKGGEVHPYVTQFKPSAITGFDVSYTPDGAWSTYKDGSPVATTIGISFKELKMLYAEEINQSGGSY